MFEVVPTGITAPLNNNIVVTVKRPPQSTGITMVCSRALGAGSQCRWSVDHRCTAD